MSQEKKSIRVLSPQQTTKKITPLISVIIGFSIGIFFATLAFLIYSNNDEPTQPNSTDINSENFEQIQGNEAISNQQYREENEDQMTPDEYHQTQPKLNELNNIFRHQPKPSQQQNVQTGLSKNPFEKDFNQAQAKNHVPNSPLSNLEKQNNAKKTVITAESKENISIQNTEKDSNSDANSKAPDLKSEKETAP